MEAILRRQNIISISMKESLWNVLMKHDGQWQRWHRGNRNQTFLQLSTKISIHDIYLCETNTSYKQKYICHGLLHFE